MKDSEYHNPPFPGPHPRYSPAPPYVRSHAQHYQLFAEMHFFFSGLGDTGLLYEFTSFPKKDCWDMFLCLSVFIYCVVFFKQET